MQTKTAISPVAPNATAPVVDEYSASPVAAQRPARSGSALAQFFGVYIDARTWSALFYLLFSLATGILYFTWAVTGLSLSIGLAILIIGAPFAVLFLLSVRGLGFLEARLVEGVLGVKVQGGPSAAKQSQGLLDRLKILVTDRRTWLSMLYLILQLPLGVIYFSLTVFLLAFSLGLMAIPLVNVLVEPQFITISGQTMTWQPWMLVTMEIGGFLFLTVSMHLIRLIGRWHGKYASRILGG